MYLTQTEIVLSVRDKLYNKNKGSRVIRNYEEVHSIEMICLNVKYSKD